MAISANEDYSQIFKELKSVSKNELGIKELNWLMKIQDLTSSSITGYEEYCYIYDLSFLINRQIENSAADTVKPDGGLEGQELNIISPSSFINADINAYFFKNICIDEISLERVISLNTESPKTVESYKFSHSFINSILTKNDVIALSIRYSSVQRDTSVVNPKDGSIDGKKSAAHSFVKSMSESSSKANG